MTAEEEGNAYRSAADSKQRELQQEKVDAIASEFLAAKQEADFLTYTMLVLRYGLDLSEHNAREILGLNSIIVDQSTISRRLKKVRIELVEELRREFPGEINMVRSQSEANFDKALKKWIDDTQKEIEEGLRRFFNVQYSLSIANHLLNAIADHLQARLHRLRLFGRT